jgi:hypothetical protein
MFKLDKVTIAMIGGIAVVVGVFAYLLLIQHITPAARCSIC